uniref:Uncharacterized protein n=1 Tax=Chromera velia CCMP2878 TaxID=1169474 RepID=A0A0G4HKP7_9ALVE|eukprot:Cvel_7250.t1-p1 / transcript=Cvel_7250.t1 / gene=Cvel_7250 / organism=Chromera_velia_CCMP2878 / gene_product=hypothetical protein / transcript_product=hypothetical protein / location=Cvel_scaffold374:37685-38807(-) / protein_length=179 / sequence_SO=supercontig / SO=protein_coding / is_pseudo=false
MRNFKDLLKSRYEVFQEDPDPVNCGADSSLYAFSAVCDGAGGSKCLGGTVHEVTATELVRDDAVKRRHLRALLVRMGVARSTESLRGTSKKRLAQMLAENPEKKEPAVKRARPESKGRLTVTTLADLFSDADFDHISSEEEDSSDDDREFESDLEDGMMGGDSDGEEEEDEDEDEGEEG